MKVIKMKQTVENRKNHIAEQEKQFQALFEQMAVGVILVESKTGMFLRANKKYCDIVGYSEEELRKLDFQSITHPDDRKSDSQYMEHLFSGNIREFSKEKRYIRKNGEIVWVNGTVSAMWNPGEQPSYHITVLQDITERKFVEIALQESERRIRHAQQISGLGYWEWNLVTGELYWSDLVYSQYGLDSKTFHPSFDLVFGMIHPEDRDRVLKTVQATLNDDAEYNIVVRVIRSDGKVRYIHTLAEVTRDTHGKPIKFVGTQLDITESKQAEEKLRESEERFKSIFDNAMDGILVGDIETKKTLFGNKMICRMLGFDEEEIKNTSISDIHPEKDLPYVMEQFEKQAANVNELAKDIPMKRKDGSVFFADINSTPIKFGGKTYLLGILRDITERKLAEEELRKHRDHLEELVKERTALITAKTEELVIAKERAEAADRLKSIFLATMSHELRTPLNSIIGFTGIILQGFSGPLNDEQKKQLDMVNNSANHLLALINDVLDISKIEAGQLNIDISQVEMNKAIKTVVNIMTQLAEKKGLILKVEVAPDVNTIMSDRRRVEQILFNLLSNAIKFTEKGEVKIECNIRDSQVITRVIDTGIGIKSEHMDRLFKPFVQLENGMSRRYEGTGLGLSICKKLVELLGGRIIVESEIGKGSVFTFTLPVKKALA